MKTSLKNSIIKRDIFNTQQNVKDVSKTFTFLGAEKPNHYVFRSKTEKKTEETRERGELIGI